MSHVVINKYHSRVSEDGKVERFEIGDQIDPTDEELAAFPDRFREADHHRTRRPRSTESHDKPDSTGSLLPPGGPDHADKK